MNMQGLTQCSLIHIQCRIVDQDSAGECQKKQEACWSHQAKPVVQAKPEMFFCEELPFDCLPVMCHEISGQGMTSQLFSPLPDNCVKGSLGFRQWEVLPEDGDQWQPVCVSLSYYFDVLNNPQQTLLSFSPFGL